MRVTLTPRLEDMVRRKVQSGLYEDASDVVREALRRMAAEDAFDAAKLERLRAAIAEAEADIAAGRITTIDSDDDLHAFFDRL